MSIIVFFHVHYMAASLQSQPVQYFLILLLIVVLFLMGGGGGGRGGAFHVFDVSSKRCCLHIQCFVGHLRHDC